MKKIISLILMLTLMCATMLTSCGLFGGNGDSEPVAKIIDVKLTDEEYAFVCKKGNTELRDKVQATLDAMVADGTFAKIAADWGLQDSVCLGQ